MRKVIWALSVVLVLLIATGVSADIRSDKCNMHSNDRGISSALDNYSGDIYVLADSIGTYTTGAGSIVLCSGPDPDSQMRTGSYATIPLKKRKSAPTTLQSRKGK